MTFAEARAAIGARVTHHASGVIHDVTDHYIWVRYDGDETALKSARPETLTLAEPSARRAGDSMRLHRKRQPHGPLPHLPQTSYDRLRAACTDILLWDHIDPDCYHDYEPIPDDDYWEPVRSRFGRNWGRVRRILGVRP
jgi:hypothetical protein